VSKSRLRIIVSGLVGLHPIGGVAWDYLQYVIGLHRLGHEVVYHEDTWSWPYHPIERRTTAEPRYSTDFLATFFAKYAPELSDSWHYVHLHDRSHGMSSQAFNRFAVGTDLFLNISGANAVPDALGDHCLKVFVDTDPGYNQIVYLERPSWSENVDRWRTAVQEHDRHATYAELIDSPSGKVPTIGFDWIPTRMPIVLDLWRPLAGQARPQGAPWTTVMTWNAFRGPLRYGGVEYKSKGEEFAKIEALPSRLNVPLQVAIGGRDAPIDQVRSLGWLVADGPATTLTPADYQSVIGGSRGELSIAKHVYVALRSGWFSCRSACYLAAGRPTVLQDTGFSEVLPTGAGLLAFSETEEAIAAVEDVESDYGRHSRAAQAVAEECFDSNLVLRRLLDDL
jgi:hypothetical protein